MNELKRALKEVKKLLQELLKIHSEFGLGFKDLPESQQEFAKLELEVLQLRIKQFKQVIKEKEMELKQ